MLMVMHLTVSCVRDRYIAR